MDKIVLDEFIYDSELFALIGAFPAPWNEDGYETIYIGIHQEPPLKMVYINRQNENPVIGHATPVGEGLYRCRFSWDGFKQTRDDIFPDTDVIVANLVNTKIYHYRLELVAQEMPLYR